MTNQSNTVLPRALFNTAMGMTVTRAGIPLGNRFAALPKLQPEDPNYGEYMRLKDVANLLGVCQPTAKRYLEQFDVQATALLATGGRGRPAPAYLESRIQSMVQDLQALAAAASTPSAEPAAEVPQPADDVEALIQDVIATAEMEAAAEPAPAKPKRKRARKSKAAQDETAAS